MSGKLNPGEARQRRRAVRQAKHAAREPVPLVARARLLMDASDRAWLAGKTGKASRLTARAGVILDRLSPPRRAVALDVDPCKGSHAWGPDGPGLERCPVCSSIRNVATGEIIGQGSEYIPPACLCETEGSCPAFPETDPPGPPVHLLRCTVDGCGLTYYGTLPAEPCAMHDDEPRQRRGVA